MVISLSTIMRFLGYVYWNIPLFVGLILVGIINLKRIDSKYPFKSKDKQVLFIEMLTVFMSAALICRYFYIDSTKWITLIFIPLYSSFGILYLVLNKLKSLELRLTTILYLVLILPMLFGSMSYSPTKMAFFEQNPYNDVNRIFIDLPTKYVNEKTKELSSLAYELRGKKRYRESILLYKKALKIEPENEMLLFDLSEAYARVGELDSAIALLDKAIEIDSSYAAFYSNRGLLYYKQSKNRQAEKDYLRALKLDSTIVSFHTNLSFTYYYMKDFENACSKLNDAIELGFDVNSEPLLREMKRKKCK